MDTKTKTTADMPVVPSRDTSHGTSRLADVVTLGAPQIEAVSNGELDPADVPEGAKFTMSAWQDMAQGDVVMWYWLGQSDGGQASGEITVDTVGEVVVTVPRAVLEINADGGDTVAALYAVTPDGGDRLESAATQFKVLPLADGDALPKPSVLEAVGDALNPDDLDVEATVIVAPYEGMAAGDTVWFRWGEGTGGGEYIRDVFISANSVGRDVEEYVPKAKVEFFDTATVTVYYTVDRADGSSDRSDDLVLRVGESVSRWPAPYILEATGDYLPDGAYERGVRTVVEQHADMQTGDKVTIYWGEGDREYIDSVDLPRPMEVQFRVPKDIVDRWYGEVVSVRYTITRGALVIHSEVLNLGVGIEPSSGLPAPQMPQVKNGELNVSDLTNGADVTVLPYENMKSGDIVDIIWGEGAGNGGMTLQQWITDSTVDKPIDDFFDQRDVERFVGQTVEVRYEVFSVLGDRDSEILTFDVVRAATSLAPPEIPAVSNGELDPRQVTGGANVVVPRSTEHMSQGDTIRLFWHCTNDDSDFTADTIVGGGTGDFDFIVPYDKINAGIDGTVTVSYDVLRLGAVIASGAAAPFVVNQTPLPAVVLIEANDGNLDPDDVPAAGASAEIAATAMFADGDVVTLHWRGANEYTTSHTVVPAEAGKGLVMMVPQAEVEKSNGSVVSVHYTILRKSGGLTEESPPSTYEVGRELGAGDLLVIGARGDGAGFRIGGASRYLRALSAVTRKDVVAEWRYEGDVTSEAGVSFFDREPWRLLHVRTEDNATSVLPLHLVGSGIDDPAVAGAAAFGALFYTGGPYAWGHINFGGDIPSNIMGRDVEQLHTTCRAMAARLSNGTAVVWGDATHGGLVTPLPTNVKSMAGNSGAFACVNRDGTLTAWGNANLGGTLSAEAEATRDADSVVAGFAAFCVRRKNGLLLTWGPMANGGEIPDEYKDEPFVSVRGNGTAFCALRADNTVAAWGTAANGGDLSDEVAVARNIVEIAGSTVAAFAVLTSERKVMAWGLAAHGGVVPEIIGIYDDIVEVVGNNHAFCARREDGRVVCWGNEVNGGLLPQEYALESFVQVCRTATAFAGLTRDGRVLTWGEDGRGGNSSTVQPKLVDIRAVYANSQAFAAIPEGGGVVTWGLANGGAFLTPVQQSLVNQYLRYGAPGSAVSAASPQGRALAAFKARREAMIAT